MRTYEIVNEAGDVVRTVQEEDTIRPALLGGESFRLTHVDGAPAIKGAPLKLSDAEHAELPKLEPAAPAAPTEAGHQDPAAQPEEHHS